MIKLGQILLENENKEVIYLEDELEEVIESKPFNFPVIFKVEVIDWKSEMDYILKKEINAFHSEEVQILEKPENIRDIVHSTLLVKYPTILK